MAFFRATHRQNGEVVEYETAQPLPEHVGAEWILEELFQLAPDEPMPEPEPEPEPYAGSWMITKLAFRSRFTQGEKVVVEMSSLDNPAADMTVRSQAAALRAYLQDIQAATYIDLQRPDTVAGVQMLEATGLIGAGRASAILTTPPTEQEVWRG